ncbi:MAG TPA: hypothetical protein VK594_18900, partial [Streptosporangiaceae bacterium]|nr:hypothetical protein [Streptosporangiaceae bacterium]
RAELPSRCGGHARRPQDKREASFCTVRGFGGGLEAAAQGKVICAGARVACPRGGLPLSPACLPFPADAL